MRVEVEMCVIANILRLDWSRLSNTFQDYGQLKSYDSLALGSLPARVDCVIVRATADARNQTVSTERSKRRLQHYIGRKLNSFTAKSISTVTTHCIRNACESSAIVCRH